jgi:hypothetical protein
MEGYLGSDAIDKVIEFAVVSVLHQAVDIGVKAWEFFVEHAGELEVLDDRFVESFARD